jgi:hypothetical protein
MQMLCFLNKCTVISKLKTERVKTNSMLFQPEGLR